MKPPKHIIQWIAPHLSESEVRKIYEVVGAEFLDRFTKELKKASPDLNKADAIDAMLAAKRAAGLSDES